MDKGHILKFVAKGKTFDENVGIKTFPRQTYGVSEQSPEHFKQKNTLIGEHGYIYKHENLPQFHYASQRKTYNIHKEVDEEDLTKLHLKMMNNSLAFHRKKGRLSQFMDKNGWMSPVTPIMGFERSQQARYFSNRDRGERIKSLKPTKVYQNKLKQPKVNQEYFNTISTLMTQKLKIRKERNQLNEHNLLLSARVESRKQKQRDPIHVENVVENMAKTSLDFYSTSSTFYNRNDLSREDNRNDANNSGKASPQKLRFRSSISKRGQSPAKSFKETTIPLVKDRFAADVIDRQDQNVEKWYRQTCHGNWIYKPKEASSDDEF